MSFPLEVPDPNAIDYVLQEARDAVLRNERVYRASMEDKHNKLVLKYVSNLEQYLLSKGVFVPEYIAVPSSAADRRPTGASREEPCVSGARAQSPIICQASNNNTSSSNNNNIIIRVSSSNTTTAKLPAACLHPTNTTSHAERDRWDRTSAVSPSGDVSNRNSCSIHQQVESASASLPLAGETLRPSVPLPVAAAARLPNAVNASELAPKGSDKGVAGAAAAPVAVAASSVSPPPGWPSTDPSTPSSAYSLHPRRAGCTSPSDVGYAASPRYPSSATGSPFPSSTAAAAAYGAAGVGVVTTATGENGNASACSATGADLALSDPAHSGRNTRQYPASRTQFNQDDFGPLINSISQASTSPSEAVTVTESSPRQTTASTIHETLTAVDAHLRAPQTSSVVRSPVSATSASSEEVNGAASAVTAAVCRPSSAPPSAFAVGDALSQFSFRLPHVLALSSPNSTLVSPLPPSSQLQPQRGSGVQSVGPTAENFHPSVATEEVEADSPGVAPVTALSLPGEALQVATAAHTPNSSPRAVNTSGSNRLRHRNSKLEVAMVTRSERSAKQGSGDKDDNGEASHSGGGGDGASPTTATPGTGTRVYCATDSYSAAWGERSAVRSGKHPSAAASGVQLMAPDTAMTAAAVEVGLGDEDKGDVPISPAQRKREVIISRLRQLAQAHTPPPPPINIASSLHTPTHAVAPVPSSQQQGPLAQQQQQQQRQTQLHSPVAAKRQSPLQLSGFAVASPTRSNPSELPGASGSEACASTGRLSPPHRHATLPIGLMASLANGPSGCAQPQPHEPQELLYRVESTANIPASPLLVVRGPSLQQQQHGQPAAPPSSATAVVTPMAPFTPLHVESAQAAAETQAVVEENESPAVTLPHGVQKMVLNDRTYFYIPTNLPPDLREELRQQYDIGSVPHTQPQQHEPQGQTSTSTKPAEGVARSIRFTPPTQGSDGSAARPPPPVRVMGGGGRAGAEGASLSQHALQLPPSIATLAGTGGAPTRRVAVSSIQRPSYEQVCSAIGTMLSASRSSAQLTQDRKDPSHPPSSPQLSPGLFPQQQLLLYSPAPPALPAPVASTYPRQRQPAHTYTQGQSPITPLQWSPQTQQWQEDVPVGAGSAAARRTEIIERLRRLNPHRTLPEP